MHAFCKFNLDVEIHFSRSRHHLDTVQSFNFFWNRVFIHPTVKWSFHLKWVEVQFI